MPTYIITNTETNKTSEKFANWYYEKNLLGYTYGKTLKDIFSTRREGLMSVREINELPEKSRVIFVGRIEDEVYSGVSKVKKSKYLKMFISDETASTKVMIFNKKMEECKMLNSGIPKKKQIVVIKGTRFDEVVFADIITVQDNKVFTKLSEVKDLDVA